MTTLLTRLKNAVLTEIQEDGGISADVEADDIEDIFEDMLDEAIYDEDYTTVIFHQDVNLNVNWESYDGGIRWDYEGTDIETGDPTGTLILPNENGDFIIPNVEIGTEHIVFPKINGEYIEPAHADDNISQVMITKTQHEFTINEISW